MTDSSNEQKKKPETKYFRPRDRTKRSKFIWIKGVGGAETNDKNCNWAKSQGVYNIKLFSTVRFRSLWIERAYIHQLAMTNKVIVLADARVFGNSTTAATEMRAHEIHNVQVVRSNVHWRHRTRGPWRFDFPTRLADRVVDADDDETPPADARIVYAWTADNYRRAHKIAMCTVHLYAHLVCTKTVFTRV